MLPIIVTQARALLVSTPEGACDYIGSDLRDPEQITRFFGGLELLDPGLVPCSRWRPDVAPRPDVGVADGQPAPVDEYSGVARKG